ncbi:MAG: hypothetical protein GX282_00535 [Campylobacteraceae bacterium]|nr:hypothetical protein [Campylobacteraceae bacterium]
MSFTIFCCLIQRFFEIILGGIIAMGFDAFYTRLVYGVIIIASVCVYSVILNKK